MDRAELLSQKDTFIFQKDSGDANLLKQLENDHEILRIVEGVYYRGTPCPSGTTPPPQESVLSLLLPSGWGYTGWSASSLLGASTRVPEVTEVSLPRDCTLPKLTTSHIRPNRLGRHMLSPMEVSVLEALETYPTYAECSLSELIDNCREFIHPSEAARLVSCTVNEPKPVRDLLITVLSR